MHCSQCALGRANMTLLPYNFSTGCTGQSEEHQALFHSKKNPMVTPTVATPTSSKAVACPLTLKTAWRKGTITYKAKTEIKLSTACKEVLIIFRLDSPR